MNPFNDNYFLGYVNEVTPQYIKIHFPSSTLLNRFHHEGTNYAGGGVGNFIVIEGEEYGFLAQMTEIKLSDSEKKELTAKAIEHKDSDFRPIGKAELLLSFNVFSPEKVQKTASKYPLIGAKVYSCSDDQIRKYVAEFGKKKDENENVYATLGKLVTNDAECNVSLNSLFGRHCAVVGTTGGGKSWTVSKLIEEVTTQTNNKIILIDATGEYNSLNAESFILGLNSYFPYQKLSIPDLFYLLRPTGQSQRPILLEAIRSLKIQKILGKTSVYVKTNTLKSDYRNYYNTYIKQIENNLCDFDIKLLSNQIKEECIYPDADFGKAPEKFGSEDKKTYDYQTSLISRITDLLNTDVFEKLFGFNITQNTDCTSIIEKIDGFLKAETTDTILRISFENIPSSFSAKEIVSNALASYLLQKARKGEFKAVPIVLIMDEAHQFLNKAIKDEFFEMHSLDAFDLIAKECRKYGLFLCLATQMPRDIPIGTLSQMGTFIVHRLINEKDKQAIENAASSANRNALSFLPILGEGEALLVGVDFPMPLFIKIDEPKTPPNSNTPRLSKK
ncbi:MULTISPECIES: ATP-binding protein [Capnocytophaga]|uniref:Helicase HerA central domain-containing protein n=1 Tax=Capnocytophaga canis TaxID=1848903 RepID=A0A0B7IG64_9FLAO|nr:MULTISPECIES: ATP-binding protein [Capnocytophaga]GIM50778.1 hypothetical protein CAPN003_22300 [Capnocytophaga stomatis]CEN50896.1 conserved hypothetical protein [Capnocytophaga canis]